MISRRRFLIAGGAFAAPIFTGLYTWKIEPHWLQIVERPLPLENLPAHWIGRSIAQLSDLHLGADVADDYLLNTFRQVQKLQPDVIVFTGDFITYGADSWDRVARVLPSFPKGRLATLAILGNHDYGPTWNDLEISDRLVRELSRLGLTVLRNEIHNVEGLQIAGLEDLWCDRFAGAPAAITSLDRRRAALVLAHNPDTVDENIWSDYRGWILAGHTHGGQCKPPFLPPPLLPVRNKRYTAGEFALRGNRRMYISRGVGHLMQVRFNVRPEVTLYRVQSA